MDDFSNLFGNMDLSGIDPGVADAAIAAPQVSPYPNVTGDFGGGQVSPYPASVGGGAQSPVFDPAVMNMLGVGQIMQQGTPQTSQPIAPQRPAQTTQLQQPPLMPVGNDGSQPINYPGQPPSSTTIGKAGAGCGSC